MNTQYRKNLKAVAQACKDYTDKEIKKVYYDIGHNDISTDDYEGLAYSVTAPAGAKLLQLQSIGGNTVKYNPSVASDNNSTMMKTMPSTVYDFDVSKVEGASKVSENLWNYGDISVTAYNEIWKSVGKTFTLEPNTTYTISYNCSKTGDAVNYVSVADSNGDIANKDDGSFITFTTRSLTEVTFYFHSSKYPPRTGTSVYTQIMLNIGGTALPYEPYYDNIHNLELSGLKVEGANLAGGTIIENQGYAQDGGTYSSNDTNIMSLLEVMPNTTYSKNNGLWINYYDENQTFISQYGGDTFTTPSNCYYVGITIPKTTPNLMLNYGSTALTYVPYIAPTTIPIDITTIKDGNNQSLWADGKLRLNDSIEPYKATKGRTYISDLSQSSYSYFEGEQVSTGGLHWLDFSGIVLANSNDVLSNLTFETNQGDGWSSSTPCLSTTSVYGSLTIRYYTSATTAQEALSELSGIYIEYNITPIEVSINWASTLRVITGYSNGTISLLNTNNMDTANVIDYNSIIKETLATAVKHESFNIWDEEWEVGTIDLSTGENVSNNTCIRSKNYIPIISNTEYFTFVKQDNSNLYYYVIFYDNNNNFISSQTRYCDSANNYADQKFTTPSNCSFVRFYVADSYGVTYNNDICINISGTLNGTYKPHKATVTRALPYQASDGYSVGSVRNVRVFSDEEGNAIKKRENNINKQDLDDLSGWELHSSVPSLFTCYSALPNSKKPVDNTTNANMICNLYTTGDWDRVELTNKNIAMSTDGSIRIYDEMCKNTTDLLDKINDIPLYYELDDSSKTKSDMDDFDYYFDVDEGDVITFVNANNQQVYATYSFLIKEAQSNE